MSRKPNKPSEPAPAPAILPAVVERIEAAQELIAARQKTVSALAVQLNYNGSTDPAVLENSAKDAIRRIGAGIFELGAYLLLLKEACEYGKFIPALERLGIEARAAQRYMAVTRRFAANATSVSHLEGAGIRKLVELLPLDDEQLEDLTELGQTGELALDDVARMSVKELRAKVRELRKDKDADKKLLDTKNARIDKLEREKHRIQRESPDAALAATKKEATGVMADALGLLRGDFRQALAALAVDNGPEGGNAVFMAGLVGQLAAELAALREEFGLPDVSNAADAELAAEVEQWGK